MKRRLHSLALRVSLSYILVAGFWVWASDLLTRLVVRNLTDYQTASVCKDLGFALVTALLLYMVLKRVLRTEFEARTRAEESARRLAELQTIVEHSGELLFKHDLNRHIIYVSPQHHAILDYSQEELVGDWKRLLTDNPINKLALERNELAIKTGERQPPCLIEVRKRDGNSPVLLEVHESPLKDSGGKVVAIVGALRDVTELEKARSELRLSEERLRALYNSMNEGLALYEIVYDKDGQPVDYRILEVNPAYEGITGLAREKVIGALGSQAYGLNPPPFLGSYAVVAASGRPTLFETFFEPIQKHLSISAFSPKPGQVATVFVDISKRKEAERQICILNQVYALISNVNEAIVRSSGREMLFRDACRIAVESAQFRMAWVGLAEPSTGEIRPVAWAGREDGYLEILRRTAALTLDSSGPTAVAIREGRVEVCPEIADGSCAAPWHNAAAERGYRASIALPLRLGGRSIGAFCVYATEPNFFSAIVIESLVEVVADLSFALELFERNRQREIEQQQLRLQHSALEAAANAIVITNRGGAIQWVNDAFTRLTGYGREEVVGHTCRLLKSGMQDADFYRELWQTVIAGAVWQGVLTNKRKDGTLHDEEMTITPVRSAAGEITHFIAIKQDISERRRLEQQFLRAQRMESIGLLAGGIAHDLNNVLAPVLMALPLLRNDLGANERETILETLERSVRRGTNIVQQVLTFARGVEGRRVAVQLRHLLREMGRIVEETFPRDIRIKVSAASDLWLLQGDPTQIHQVLLNLAVNARDAMPNGGQLSFLARNVELKEPRQFQHFSIAPGAYVSVSVVDTGSGISPDIMERMFEPFFTTKPVGKGTGLGLSTVLGIVKSHGGLVQVESRIGSGSTFTVFLPAARNETAVEDQTAGPAIVAGRGETVLVVDDEADILDVARSILETYNYKVISANHGKEGVSAFVAQRAAIRVVLTDLMMPAMDGLALTRALRQIDGQVPIVVMTGLMDAPGDGDRSSQLRQLGVNHFLQKPFQTEELLAILREALKG
jgi:PAS domain S-box-containing protein